MTDSSDASEVRQGAVEHLHTALAAEEADEVKFHIRQALQLLEVE
ncbi:hypothetical protein [Halorussus ruber]|nr:hypothetical protein [Halorussus ruber]